MLFFAPNVIYHDFWEPGKLQSLPIARNGLLVLETKVYLGNVSDGNGKAGLDQRKIIQAVGDVKYGDQNGRAL